MDKLSILIIWILTWIVKLNPLFVDAENGNLQLSKKSPCIDSGTSENVSAYDILGMKRPRGKGVDMGAFEFKPGNGPKTK